MFGGATETVAAAARGCGDPGGVATSNPVAVRETTAAETRTRDQTFTTHLLMRKNLYSHSRS